jgi:hypothetical protein
LPTAYDGRRQAPLLPPPRMTKKRLPDPAPEASVPSLSPEKAEKGSKTSMWELLLQLRVLLPYLARLVPLLDRGTVRAAPDLTELTRGIAEMQTGSRDLEVQARNQALQLERIEQQMARLRVVHENSLEENRALNAELRSFRRTMLIIAIVVVVLLAACAGMIVFMVVRP